MNILRELWNDESGAVVSTEIVLYSTAVFGLSVGLNRARNAIVREFDDLATAIECLDQSYSYSAVDGPLASSAGSGFVDYRARAAQQRVASGQAVEQEATASRATNLPSYGMPGTIVFSPHMLDQ